MKKYSSNRNASCYIPATTKTDRCALSEVNLAKKLTGNNNHWHALQSSRPSSWLFKMLFVAQQCWLLCNNDCKSNQSDSCSRSSSAMISVRAISKADHRGEKCYWFTELIIVTTATTDGVLFQAGARFAQRKQNFGLFGHFGFFVANLRTFWCAFTRLNNAVVSQNWQISGILVERKKILKIQKIHPLWCILLLPLYQRMSLSCPGLYKFCHPAILDGRIWS